MVIVFAIPPANGWLSVCVVAKLIQVCPGLYRGLEVVIYLVNPFLKAVSFWHPVTTHKRDV